MSHALIVTLEVAGTAFCWLAVLVLACMTYYETQTRRGGK